MMSFLTSIFDSKARAAARDLDRRIRTFRDEIAAARAGTPDQEALARLRTRPAELGVAEEEVELEIEIVDGLIEVCALRKAEARGEPLAAIETSHRAIAPGEICRFAAPAFRPDAPDDPGGKLFFTDRRIIYLGSPSVAISWAHVADVRDQDRDLIVRVRPESLKVFRCNSYVDTLRGACIATRLRQVKLPSPLGT